MRKKFWVFSSNTVLTWGKYKGQKVHEVLRADPDYLKWCVTNIWNISIRIKPELDKAYKDKFGVTLSQLREEASSAKK